jgi:hypothetical protein
VRLDLGEFRATGKSAGAEEEAADRLPELVAASDFQHGAPDAVLAKRSLAHRRDNLPQSSFAYRRRPDIVGDEVCLAAGYDGEGRQPVWIDEGQRRQDFAQGAVATVDRDDVDAVPGEIAQRLAQCVGAVRFGVTQDVGRRSSGSQVCAGLQVARAARIAQDSDLAHEANHELKAFPRRRMAIAWASWTE